MFATLMYLGFYLLSMWGCYSKEAEAIGQKSVQHFSGDISSNMGFFEILKSANFNLFGMFFSEFIVIFIPYLLIATYFFDYKNEIHAGWMRIFISVQLLIPLIALFYFELPFTFYSGIADFIFIIGIAEIVVLILIKIFIWIRDGFAKPAI